MLTLLRRHLLLTFALALACCIAARPGLWLAIIAVSASSLEQERRVYIAQVRQQVQALAVDGANGMPTMHCRKRT